MSLIITSFCILITISLYILSIKLHEKFPSPFTMPIFLSTVAIIFVLFISGISYEDYTIAKDIMTFLLGPATVALAVPLYRQRKVVFKHIVPVFLGILSGTFITIIVAIYMSSWFRLSTEMTRSFSIKSITIPIASEVAPIIEAHPSLVMLFVMITGMTGAMFGSFFLNIGNVHAPLARGLSFGTISHGIGTSQAMKEEDLQEASSSVAMGLAGIITSLIIPWVLPLLLL